MFKSKYYLPDDAVKQSYQNEEKIVSLIYDKNFEVFDNAVILPLKSYRRSKINNGEPVNYGGVFDENLKLLAGYFQFKQKTGNIGHEYGHPYEPKHIEYSDQTVIFSGDINGFGHFITDSMVRLWYAATNEDKNIKVALLLRSNLDFENSYQLRMIELLGIGLERILLVEKPTKFKSVIVPKQSVFWDSSIYNDDLLKIVYDKIRLNIEPKTEKKIYLSRSELKNPVINESYFETFFSSRGYKILHPEKLPITEQLEYLAGADEIVCTYGSLSHTALFAKPGTKLICLLRHYRVLGSRQLIIDRIKQLDCVYIDTSFNLLPSHHSSGLCMMAPTVHWWNFLSNEYGINQDKDVFEYLNCSDFKIGEFTKQYLKRLSSQWFVSTIYGFKFDPYSHLKTLYDSLDPNSEELMFQALKVTNNPDLSGHLFKYKRSDTGIECIVKLLASGRIWAVDQDRLSGESFWSYLNGRLYFLSSAYKTVSEFVIEGTESKYGWIKYKGVIQSKVTNSCSLESFRPLWIRNWIIKHIIKYLVNNKRYKKLKQSPEGFFRDSKNPIIQFFGRYYIRGNSTVIFFWRKQFQEYFNTHDIKHMTSILKDGMDDISIKYIDNFIRLSKFWYKSTCIGNQRTEHELQKLKLYQDFKETFEQPFADILTVKPYFFYDIFGLADLSQETLSLIDGKIIINGGGLNGDTSLAFNRHFPNSEIYVYEPVRHKMDIINRFLAIDNCNNKIIPINKLLASEITNKFMRFGDGSNVETTTIDNDYTNSKTPVGLIKLDSEEVDTCIKGASKVIARDRPVLAIHIHRSPENFFELKSAIKMLNPDYKFMIRKSEPSLPQAGLVLIAY